MTRLALASAAATLLLACSEKSPEDSGGEPNDTREDMASSSCTAVETAITAEEVTALGFSGQSLLEAVAGQRSATFVAVDGSTSPLSLEVHSLGELRFVDQEVASSDSGAEATEEWVECPDHVVAAATLSFATEDGAFAEEIPVELSTTDGLIATFYAELDYTALSGSYDLAAHVTSTDYDELSMDIHGQFDAASTTGAISAQATGSDDCEPGEDCAAWAELVEVGGW